MHIAAFKGMGAIPTPINWPETFVALQQGTVDGQDNPISVIEAAKLYEVQKHLSLTEHLYSPALFLASPAVLAKLPQADQDALRATARVGAAAMRRRHHRSHPPGGITHHALLHLLRPGPPPRAAPLGRAAL